MQAQASKLPRRVKTKFPGIYKSVSGRYEIAFRDSDGKLRFRTIGENLEEAKAARAEVVDKLAKGVQVRPTKATFADFAEEWLAGLNKRPRTIAAHRYALTRHLLPRFAKKKLAEIRVDDVARPVADMQRKGYAGWTIVGTLGTLGNCLGKAKRRGLIPANPVRELERSERPTVGGDEKRILSEAEIQTMLAKAGNFRAPIAVMLFAGLRLGETLGLRWQDVDFAEGFLRVRFQLSPTRELAELKTKKGRRNVVLIPQLALILKEHRLALLYKAPGDFVFPAPDGRGRDHRSVGRGIERTLRRTGLDGEGISAHAFRHTYASMLIVGLGLDVVRVAEQLGHANPRTTLGIYAHLFGEGHAEETRTKLAEGFGHLLAASGQPG